MRDCQNHPSVAWWDINNETRDTILTGLISELRTLDLSNRAWDNGYNLPEGDNDPVEDHNYRFYSKGFGGPVANLEKFQDGMAEKTTNAPHPTAHACVLNEYGWLWLKRNGQPTLLTNWFMTPSQKDTAMNKDRNSMLILLPQKQNISGHIATMQGFCILTTLPVTSMGL